MPYLMFPRRESKNPGLFLIVTIMFLIGIPILHFFEEKGNKETNTKECFKEKEKAFSGVILSSYYDDNINVKAFRINFTNETSYIFPFYLKSLSGFVEEGDSVSKKAGSFDFFIFKKGQKNPIIIKSTVDCENF